MPGSIPMKRWKSWLINASLVFAALAVSLAAVEVALRLFQPVELRIKGGDIRLPYFKRYEMHLPDARKLDREVVHSRNALGFRGDNAPRDFADHLTIVAVGGSTTECFYLSDGRTWPELVGGRIGRAFSRVWINNAGLSGHSTFGHLQLMRRHVVPLGPRMVLFLVGINDRAKAEGSRFDESISPRRPGFAQTLKQALTRNSELAALLWNIHRTLRATELGIDSREKDFAALAPRDAGPGKETEVLARHRGGFVAAYGRRLEDLVTLAREGGIVPVLITQPAVYGPAVDAATGVDLARIPAEPVNGAIAWKVLELYNDETRRVAALSATPLIDLARLLPKDTRYFYDFLHFSNAGADKVAEIVAAGLCPVLAAQLPEFARAGCGAMQP